MNFERIRLRNFKPFGNGDLRLTDGVTVIHGLNGSGKSSLLESCFFALYGARALNATLEEVVTTGENEADVELWFAHDDARYHVRRELRRRGDRVATTRCTLEREGDDAVIEGATDVEAFVTDLLRMDAEAFVNCAYVRQGEVNKLIEATPAERQRMIDDLLQLGTLEEYRERAGDARLGVEDVLGEKRGEFRRIEDQIAELEERDLHDRLNALRSERNEVVAGEEGIEHYESQRETAVETREEAESILEDAAEKRDELDDLEAEIEELEAAIRETADERDDLDGSIESARRRRQSADERAASLAEAADLAEASEAAIAERREALDDRESGLREELETARESVTRYENQAENLADRADDLAGRAAEERERAEEREGEAEAARETLTDLEDDLAAAESAVESLRARFEDAPVAVGGADEHREAVASELEAVRGSYNDAAAELQSARDDVAATEALLAAGNCPECGRPVEDSPEVASLETDRERVAELDDRVAELDDRREKLTERLERADALVEAESRLADRRQRVELLTDRVEEKRDAAAAAEEAAAERRAAAEEFDAEADEKRELAAERRDELAEARATVADLEDELDGVEKRRERIDEIEAELESAADAAAEVERLSERRELLAERIEERRERLGDLRERRDDLRDRIDEEQVAAARDERERAAAYVERVDETLESLRERRDELQGQIGAVEQEIETLESLRGDRDELVATVDRLESLHSEAAELEAAYGDLRSELRRRNVDRLERTLNETFDLVYANDAYSRLELDEEYALTVYQKDGQPLRPEQLSGGERALFNLSLRCAIYRLLAEGVEGAAPTPPLILDEPTVFLDDGHVARLRRLVEEMRGFGVSQILIVSHDEELIAAADDLVTVEKNPTTNRSSVDREPDPTVAAADVD